MSRLEVGLSAGLALALAAVVVLAISRRRVAYLLAAERAARDARALIARAALTETFTADVGAVVGPLRALLEQHAQVHGWALAELSQLVVALRQQVEWFAAITQYAHAQRAQGQHAQAGAQPAAAAVQPAPAGPAAPTETTRKPDRAPRSRERPSPRGMPPAVPPPGSAEPLDPTPAQLAAGLERPRAQPAPAARRPEAQPVDDARAPRSATMLGMAPPAPSGPRKPLVSSPTLISAGVAAPSNQPAFAPSREARTDDGGKKEGAP